MSVEELEIAAARAPLQARITLPGSKSITNRALLLAAMALGRSTLDSVLLSDDTGYMTTALRTLGFRIEVDEAARRMVVDGIGGAIPSSNADLFVGGAGTAMRFLVGFLTLGQGHYRIDGNQRMRQRPIGPLLDAMQQLGAAVYDERNNRCPPIIVEKNRGTFSGGETTIDARESSQFVSAMMMPAPLWPRGLKLRIIGDTARPFIEMTLRLMEAWGARSQMDGDTITVPGGQNYNAMQFVVEPDASAAGYFAAAAALCGGEVTIEGLSRGSVQGDIGFFEILQRMGAGIQWTDGGVVVTGTGTLNGVDVAMNSMPDMVSTLAAIARSLRRRHESARSFIRYHESDRLRALATELRKLGATVDDFEDGLAIQPST